MFLPTISPAHTRPAVGVALKTTVTSGNLLGAARAEVDGLLSKAFIETAAYRALAETEDYNFVVGRRGTGKSALFHRLKDHFADAPGTLPIANTPPEHYTIEFQRLLLTAGNDYRSLRAIARLVWRASLLLEALGRLLATRHYKLAQTPDYAYLRQRQSDAKALLQQEPAARYLSLLKEALRGSHHATEVPAKLAQSVQVEKLQHAIRDSLQSLGLRIVVIYDGLDEGWVPDVVSTAVLGGLALTAADLTDSRVGIYPILFIRDNMFRSLAQLDTDFTRHIEGHTLRLHWDENSLLRLVAQRLRIALGLAEVESDIRVWNRFAQRELKERDGFLLCLHHTLYRPRDILVLLNEAYQNAARDGRDSIIPSDIETSSTRISQHRLEDLLKEYATVLPGLSLFVAEFRGRRAHDSYGAIVKLLDEAAARADFSDPASRDFGVFHSGPEIFSALYSVGFLGLRDLAGPAFTFCHDGSASPLSSVEADRPVTVHPCYWKALELQGDVPPEEVVIQINDEYEAKASQNTRDLRIALLGEVQGALPRIPIGREGSQQFEQWVFRTAKLLFGGTLSNFQLKPNAGGIQQRDVVATNMATRGFWKRILDDYKSRQVIFEVKNYEEVEPDDFRQALSYSTGEYGRFLIIVTRAGSESITEREQGWIKTLYFEHDRLVLIVPAMTLARCVSKLRSERKYDYTEDTMGKRADLFVRSYLKLAHGVSKYRPRRR